MASSITSKMSSKFLKYHRRVNVEFEREGGGKKAKKMSLMILYDTYYLISAQGKG